MPTVCLLRENGGLFCPFPKYPYICAIKHQGHAREKIIPLVSRPLKEFGKADGLCVKNKKLKINQLYKFVEYFEKNWTNLC